jgi:hypothetical protein
VWLDANLTSPYHFYQFWLNVADADAIRYIKIFTFIPLDEIAELERQHLEAPHMRTLQKRLAEDITVRVHSREDYNQAVEASEILFGKGTTESLAALPENVFTSVFEGVPQFTVAKADLEAGINVLDLLAVNTTIFPSKGEARKMLVGGGVSINKIKLEDAEAAINDTQLLNARYLLVTKGKKNNYLIIAKTKAVFLEYEEKNIKELIKGFFPNEIITPIVLPIGLDLRIEYIFKGLVLGFYFVKSENLFRVDDLTHNMTIDKKVYYNWEDFLRIFKNWLISHKTDIMQNDLEQQ